jgi:GGDEF domain-containing protein
MGAGIASLGPTTARRLLLGLGSLVLLAVAALMWVRGVDGVEVGATLLFLPVFAGLVLWQIRGGLIAGGIAAVAYLMLRYPALEAVGFERFGGLIAGRTLAYLAFGGIGGWAFRELERSLDKLELHDEIDDATGLRNARFLLSDVELEVARSTRYQTVFSVVEIGFPAAGVDALPRRRRAALLGDVGRALTEAGRTVDRAVHARDDERHRLAVLLPETGKEGAGIVADRLAQGVVGLLAKRGVELDGARVSRRAITYPGDDKALEGLRREFAAIDRREHPQVATEDA